MLDEGTRAGAAGRDGDRREGGRRDGGRRDMRACAEVRHLLSRVAAAVGSGVPTAAVVPHVRGCDHCRAFVDELARVSCWLDALVPGPIRPPGEDQHGGARRALVEQLAARLARDLAAWARRDRARPLEQRRRDRARLRLLLVAEGLEARLPDRAGELVEGCDEVGAATPPFELLGLARELDPAGVDVALPYIQQLVRRGDVGRADREAERVLRWLG